MGEQGKLSAKARWTILGGITLGGLLCATVAQAQAKGVLFSANTAGQSILTGGGAVFSSQSSPVFVGCEFFANVGFGSGGGSWDFKTVNGSVRILPN